MSIFTKDVKVKLAPQSEASKRGQDYLTQLLGQTPDTPVQGTADLTPMQRLMQQSLPGLLDKTDQAGDLASGEYSKRLSGGYDPQTSSYYEPFRQEADRLQQAGAESLQQRAGLGGMPGDSSSAVAAGSFSNLSNSAVLKELGRLANTESGRTSLAAEGVQGAEAQRLGNVAAVGGIAEAAQFIEQQRADSLYVQAMQQMLFPYQVQGGIATDLLYSSPDTMLTGGGLKEHAEWGNLIGSGVKSYYENRSKK